MAGLDRVPRLRGTAALQVALRALLAAIVSGRDGLLLRQGLPPSPRASEGQVGGHVRAVPFFSLS